jgi:thiamine biosynthesis lipoprotein ApbE
LILATMKGAGQHHVKLSDDGTVAFFSPLTRLDLGPMALGYAVDLSIVNLRRQGNTNVFVQFGQTWRGIGHAEPGQLWVADLPDPWGATQHCGTVTLPRNAALAVCRPFERTVEIAGAVYGSLIDPRSGCPVDGTRMAAVLAPSATMANALAQSLAVVGLEEAPELLAKFPRCSALIVPNAQPAELWATEKFARAYQPRAGFPAAERIISVEKEDSDPAGAPGATRASSP